MNGDSAEITGIGLVTPVGSDIDGFFEAVCKGQSGLQRPPEGHPAWPDLDVAGLAPAIDPASVLPPKETRAVDRFVLLGLLAAERALADAGLDVGRDADPYRVAVVAATGGGGLETFEEYSHRRFERGRALPASRRCGNQQNHWVPFRRSTQLLSESRRRSRCVLLVTDVR